MKKKVSFALCTALMLCSMSVAALAAEPMTEADTVSTMISAADTLPSVSAYPAEVRASEENGVYRLEKVYYLTAKDDPATIPTADFVLGDRIFEKCGIRRDEGGDGGKTLEIRGKRRLSARDGGANYQQS